MQNENPRRVARSKKVVVAPCPQAQREAAGWAYRIRFCSGILCPSGQGFQPTRLILCAPSVPFCRLTNPKSAKSFSRIGETRIGPNMVAAPEGRAMVLPLHSCFRCAGWNQSPKWGGDVYPRFNRTAKREVLRLAKAPRGPWRNALCRGPFRLRWPERTHEGTAPHGSPVPGVTKTKRRTARLTERRHVGCCGQQRKSQQRGSAMEGPVISFEELRRSPRSTALPSFSRVNAGLPQLGAVELGEYAGCVIFHRDLARAMSRGRQRWVWPETHQALPASSAAAERDSGEGVSH